MDVFKQIKEDQLLSKDEKIKLIERIKDWQEQRWKRLRKWHNFENLPLSTKHMFMQREIVLIRMQNVRLAALKEQIINTSAK